MKRKKMKGEKEGKERFLGARSLGVKCEVTNLLPLYSHAEGCAPCDPRPPSPAMETKNPPRFHDEVGRTSDVQERPVPSPPDALPCQQFVDDSSSSIAGVGER